MAENDLTAELPQVRNWWVAVVTGIAAATAGAAAANADALAGVAALAPLRQGIGPYNNWAVLGGVAAIGGLACLLAADMWVLSRWAVEVRRFDPPELPPNGWLDRAYQHCLGLASIGQRSTIDEIRQQIRVRSEEYRHAAAVGWLFKYYLLAFVIPTAGLGVAILNLRTAGPAFPVAEILWPVAGGTLAAGAILVIALLYSRSITKTINIWRDKTIRTANAQMSGPVVTPPVPVRLPSPPASDPAHQFALPAAPPASDPPREWSDERPEPAQEWDDVRPQRAAAPVPPPPPPSDDQFEDYYSVFGKKP